MNQLYNRLNPQQTPQLLQFLKQTNPQQAKAQLEQMIQSGQVSSQELNNLKQQAQAIATTLGLK